MNAIDRDFFKTYSEIVNNRSKPLPTTWVERSFPGSELTSRNVGRVKDSVSDRHALKDSVLAIIHGAKEMLVLCSFLLADGQVEQALLDAEQRGVRVYCLIAAETRLDREEPEGEFDKKVLNQHRAMLKRLAGKVMFRTSSIFHAKVVLADPFTSNANGVLLTANITTDAMQRNEELLLELEITEVKQLAEYLKWALWEAAEHESIESGEFAAVRPIGVIDHPAECFPVIATTEKRRQISEKALAMIQSAQSEIQVSCFGWDLEHPVIRALVAKAKSGVSVTVFARIRPASMAALETLAASGAVVFGFKWLHAKALVVDQQEAMVMSANFQTHGLDEGFELGVFFHDDRVEDLLYILQYWESRAQWQLQTEAKVGDISGKIQVWDGKSLTAREVHKRIDLDLGDVTSFSAENIDGPMPDLPPPAGRLPYLAHELNCQWKVTAPRLTKGSKQVFRQQLDQDENKTETEKQHSKEFPYDPPVYKESNGRIVVAIKSPQQLDLAVRLKAEQNAFAIVVE